MSVFINDGGVEKEAKMIYVNDGGIDKLVSGGGGGGISFPYYETRSTNTGSLPPAQELPPFESGDIFIVSLTTPSAVIDGWDNVGGNVWVTDIDPGPSVEVTPSPGAAFSLVQVRGASGIGQVVTWGATGSTIRLPGFNSPRSEGSCVLAFTYSPTNVTSYSFVGSDFPIRHVRNSNNSRQVVYIYVPVGPRSEERDHTTELTETKSSGTGTNYTSRIEILPL